MEKKILNIEQSQREICQNYGAKFVLLDFNLKLGVADDFFSNIFPLNGLRHPAEVETCGWYLWAGKEISLDEDYFKPMHVFHLIKKCPNILKYLGLPAGWRFLVTDNYEDVWFDKEIVQI